MVLPNHLGFTGPCAVKPIYCHKAVVKQRAVFISHGVRQGVRRACMLSCFRCVWLFVTLWTVACRAPMSMRCRREEYWSGLPCPPPGDLPVPGIKPGSPALQAASLAPSHLGSPSCSGPSAFLDGFQGKVFKGRMRERFWGYVINSWTFFWLVIGEVIESEHHQQSGFNWSGSMCLWAAYS